MIFTWLKLRMLRKEVDFHAEQLKDIHTIFEDILKFHKKVNMQFEILEQEVKIFRSFLDHVQIEINQCFDGSIVFKSKYKYTKVGTNGAVERCN